MALDVRQMLQDLDDAHVKLEFWDNWTAEETANYIIHQYNISFLNRDKKDFIEESRSLGRNTSRTSTGKFKDRNKK